MLQAATYNNGKETLKVSIERIDVLLKDSEILNFPRLITLAGDRLVLAYGRGRHTGAESRTAAISEDGGKTWANVAPDSPWADNVQTSGLLGYTRDGAVNYIDVFPIGADGMSLKEFTPEKRKLGWYHRVMTVQNPTFRLRRFAPTGELMATETARLVNLPWQEGTYENYGTLLELDNGDILAGFLSSVPPFDPQTLRVRLAIARSSDHGRTFECQHVFVPNLTGSERPLCYSEHCLARLANGDILCIMRTDSSLDKWSPMYQSRSKDGGLTWSEPVCVGWPGAKPDLRLMSNGVLACTSGRGMYGHPQITHAMFSIDGTGEKWEYPFAFHTGPGCSYTSNIERDGRLYVAYSDSAFIKNVSEYNLPYQSIKWAVLNVKREARQEAAQ